MNAHELNPTRIGDLLLRLPVVSAQLGHAAPRNSLPYLESSSDPEVRFIIDILSGLASEDVADKWYGGTSAMPRLARELARIRTELRASGNRCAPKLLRFVQAMAQAASICIRARDAGAARDGVCRLRRRPSFPNNTELLRGFMVNASSGSWTLVNKTGY